LCHLLRLAATGVKVLASAAAMFASGWASQLMLQEQPPVLFWVGALLAGGALIWHHAGWSWSSTSSTDGSNSRTSAASKPDATQAAARAKPGAPVLLWLTLIGAVAMAIVMSSGTSDISSSVQKQPHLSHPGVVLNSSQVDLSAFPRDESLRTPGRWMPMDSQANAEVCTPITCSTNVTCTTDDPSCCIFFHKRLLSLMSAFWAKHGLAEDWFAVYGTLVGAIRQPGGILPWTNDMDLGVSPRLVATLERPDVRDELWSYGVHVHYDVLWKICVHARNPDPIWQAAFEKPVLLTTRCQTHDWLLVEGGWPAIAHQHTSWRTCQASTATASTSGEHNMLGCVAAVR
jgi:hypothetical protein